MKSKTKTKKQDGATLLAEAIGDGAGAVEKFAGKVGVSRTAVYNWLDRSSTPTRARAKLIDSITKGAVPATVWS